MVTDQPKPEPLSEEDIETMREGVRTSSEVRLLDDGSVWHAPWELWVSSLITTVEALQAKLKEDRAFTNAANALYGSECKKSVALQAQVTTLTNERDEWKDLYSIRAPLEGEHSYSALMRMTKEELTQQVWDIERTGIRLLDALTEIEAWSRPCQKDCERASLDAINIHAKEALADLPQCKTCQDTKLVSPYPPSLSKLQAPCPDCSDTPEPECELCKGEKIVFDEVGPNEVRESPCPECVDTPEEKPEPHISTVEESFYHDQQRIAELEQEANEAHHTISQKLVPRIAALEQGLREAKKRLLADGSIAIQHNDVDFANITYAEAVEAAAAIDKLLKGEG